MLRLAGGRAAGLGGEVVAIDGRALCRPFPDAAARSPLHPVRAWAFADEVRPVSGQVLGQVRVEGGSNGIAAMPALSEMPAPKGRVVTADAMRTQRRTAQAVTAAGGDHVPAPKGNRGAPYEDVKLHLDGPVRDGNWRCHRDVDGGRGRIGTRTARVVRDVDRLRRRHSRPGLAAVGKVVPTRGIGAGTTTGTRHHIMSAKLSPHPLGDRDPLHWVLDVTMNGDRRRNRTGHGPENPQPRTAAPAGFERRPRGAGKGRHARQIQARRMGQQPPARHDPSRQTT